MRNALIKLGLLFCLVISGATGYAQCTLDVNACTPASDAPYPHNCTAPAMGYNGKIGEAYDHTFAFNFLHTPVINFLGIPFPAPITRVEITEVLGLPPGLEISFLSSNSADGDNGNIGPMGILTPIDTLTPVYACVRVWGTPLQATTFTDSLHIIVNVYGLFGGSEIELASLDFSGTASHDIMYKIPIEEDIPQYTVNAGNDVTIDCGQSANLNAIATDMANSTFSWEPPDGLSDPASPNPTATPGSTTTYKVTATNGTLTATDEVTVTVNPVDYRIQANGLPTTFQNAPYTVRFTGLAAVFPPVGLEYYWDFGDGNTSIEQNPTHTYQNPGTYTVMLIVKKGICADTLIKPDYIVCNGSSAALTVDAGQDQTMACGSTTPIRLAATASKTGSTFKWEPTTGLSTPTQAFTIANPPVTTTYTVTATHGTETATDVVTVFVTPADHRLGFTGTPTLLTARPFSVAFRNQTQNLTLQFEWNFGDGSTATDINPTHEYMNPGKYTVTLISKSRTGGCTDTLIKVDYIECKDGGSTTLTVDAGPDQNRICGTTAQLSATANLTDATFTWSPATGLDNPNIANPKATLNATTTYTVTAKSGTQTATDVVTVFVRKATYMLNFTGNPISFTSQPFTVNFTNSTPTPGLSFLWNFGDGGTSTVQSPSYTYSSNGTYTVTLMAKRTQAAVECWDTLIRPNYIKCDGGTTGPLKVTASNDVTLKCGESTQLSAVVNRPGGQVRLVWQPMDGLSNATILNPIAKPLETITYTVTVTNMSGTETAIDSVTITVTPIPAPTISEAQGTLTASTPGVQYQWYKGTDPVNGETQQKFTPQESGKYAVEIKDNNGCTAKSNPIDFIFTSTEAFKTSGSKLVLYPNPNQGAFSIAVPRFESGQLHIYNAAGQLVHAQTAASSNGILLLSLKDQASGLYFIRMDMEGKVYQTSFIIE